MKSRHRNSIFERELYRDKSMLATLTFSLKEH